MKWVMILAFWNTTPPQESFKFFTKVFSSQQECEDAIQTVYNAAFNSGTHAQAACISEAQIGLQSY